MPRKKKEGFTAEAKPGAKKLATGAVERLNQLETEVLPKLFKDLNEAFTNIDQNFQGMRETMDALIAIVGADKVDEQIKAAREAEDDATRTQMTESIVKALADQRIKPAEKVTELSLIIGIEVDKEGISLRPGRVQIGYQSIKLSFQQVLLGQAVGFSFPTESGGTFTIQEIYEIVPPPVQASEEPVSDIGPVVEPTAVEVQG